jgi:hypothetical protein
MRLSRYSIALIVALAPSLSHARTDASTGSIVGSADPGAQIVVTATDSGLVVGIVAACDGKYAAASLKPGRYSIVEGGPHHAPRTLSVEAGGVSHVDLGAATTNSTRTCNDKKGKH